MYPRLIDYYKRIKDAHITGLSLLHDLTTQLQGERSLEEQADAAMALDQCNKLVEDLGKELRRAKYLAERITCLICLKTNNPGPVRTPYCTASLRPKMAANVPSRDTPEYKELCDYLGIDPSAPVRLHYPTIVDMVSTAVEEGKAPPPGLGELRPEFHLTIRKQKEVDAGDEAKNELEELNSHF